MKTCQNVTVPYGLNGIDHTGLQYEEQNKNTKRKQPHCRQKTQ